VAATGCGDSPAGLGAAQTSDAAMLAEILDKLESIEDRLDSLDVTVGGLSGGGLSLTGLPAEQLDSLMDLASFIALDAVSGSWEACGSFGLTLDFGLELAGEAEGKGSADLGAWAGTGAFAGATVKAAGSLGGSLKADAEGGIEYCAELGAGTPPARPQPAGPMRSPELDQLRTTLTGLTTQFNLTSASLGQSLGGISSVISAPGSVDLQSVGGNLPLPPALASMASDPLGTAAGRLQGLSADAQDALCNSNYWGSNVSTIIAEACDVIDSGGLANITAFADMANTYPAVETAVSSVCGRINSMGLARFAIPSLDVTVLGQTYSVFGGSNNRLFPSYTSVACP
jgi:hypothetical protein